MAGYAYVTAMTTVTIRPHLDNVIKALQPVIALRLPFTFV